MFDSSIEHCWILLGTSKEDLWHARMVKMTSGTPCSVAFDPHWVLRREEEFGDIIGFWHLHPGMSNHYSSIDDATMKAWVTCFGKPLVCCIQGTNGLAAWWFVDDENEPENYQVKRIKRIIFGITPSLYE